MNTPLHLLSLHNFSSGCNYKISDLLSYIIKEALDSLLSKELLKTDPFIQYTNIFQKRLLFLKVHSACIFLKPPEDQA